MKKRRSRFPAIGTDHPVPVYMKPEQGEDEAWAAFEKRSKEHDERYGHIVAHVKLLPREEVRDWENRRRAVLATDQKERYLAKETTALEQLDQLAAAARDVVSIIDTVDQPYAFCKDSPLLRARDRLNAVLGGPHELAEKTVDALVELHKEIVRESLVSLEGIEVGGIDLEDRALDPGRRLELVIGCDHLAVVSAACMRGQFPTPTQLDS